MSDISNKHGCTADSPQHVLHQQIEVSSSYIINLHKLYTSRNYSIYDSNEASLIYT